MRLFVAALCLVFPLQAMALSCLPPSVERSYGFAHESEDPYMVVIGRLGFDENELPKETENPNDAPQLTLIPAHLSGKSLSKGGFVTPFDTQIIIELRCFGPWCGGVRDGTDFLAFIRKTKEGFALSIDPCGGFAFENPSDKMLQAVTACINGAKCSSEF